MEFDHAGESHGTIWQRQTYSLSFYERKSSPKFVHQLLIVQNIFHQGKEMRNIGLNAHYIVLFKSARDKQQISMLARQVNSVGCKNL
jgi:hypothetical protein